MQHALTTGSRSAPLASAHHACGVRRMTATQIAPPEHLTWVNHQLMLHGRETEARSHNLITVGDPDIAFQVCLGPNSTQACCSKYCPI